MSALHGFIKNRWKCIGRKYDLDFKEYFVHHFPIISKIIVILHAYFEC